MTKRKASVALDNGNESNQSSSTQDNNSNSTSATNTTLGTNNNNQSTQNGTPSSNNSTTNNGNNSTPVAVTANGSQQQIGGGDASSNTSSNNQQQPKSKKERADNWSSAEIQVLHRGIETRREVFYGPPSQATKKNRELAWEAITKEVNSVSTTPRSLSQVMKKFKNEKCRAKRKFIDNDKDGHNNNNLNSSGLPNNNNNTTNNINTNLSAQNHTNNNQQQLQSQQQQQQQQQPHHMTTNETISSQPSSINVVKLAPQNVAKTMIDLPGHVQHIQMPNDDMVLIVQPEMDGLISGMNIVSDGNSQHFQKCPGTTLNNQQHNHHGQHTIQAINTGSGIVNGTMSNGMMARTIPTGSMCSLVYSTGNDVCAPDPHLGNTIASGPNTLTTNHIGINGQGGLMHHRSSVEQNQGQQQSLQHPQQQPQAQHHHQLHQPQPHQPQQPQQQQQPQTSQHMQTHQAHQQAQHHQHPHIQQNHLATTTATITSNNGMGNLGVAAESQLKNLLFNLLFKDGQHASSNNSMNTSNSASMSAGGTMPTTPGQDYNKQRNDMLAIIANSLNKIESHLGKLTKVVGSMYGQNLNLHQIGSNDNNSNISNTNSSNLNNQNSSLNNLNNNDGNNNSLTLTGTSNTIGNQSRNESQ